MRGKNIEKEENIEIGKNIEKEEHHDPCIICITSSVCIIISTLLLAIFVIISIKNPPNIPWTIDITNKRHCFNGGLDVFQVNHRVNVTFSRTVYMMENGVLLWGKNFILGPSYTYIRNISECMTWQIDILDKNISFPSYMCQYYDTYRYGFKGWLLVRTFEIIVGPLTEDYSFCIVGLYKKLGLGILLAFFSITIIAPFCYIIYVCRKKRVQEDYVKISSINERE